ncbi:MAG: polymer-forming cytoskeletal protein [Pseudomonadota bacterium]
MSHLTDLQLTWLADAALVDGPDDAHAHAHLQDCPHCQQRLALLQEETQVLSTALQADDGLDQAVAIPPFRQPLTLRGFAFANLATGLVIWAAQFLWKTLFGELAVNVTAWFTSLYFPDFYAVLSAAALYYLEEGTAMFEAYFAFVVVSLLFLGLLWVVLKYRKTKAAAAGCLVVVFAGGLAPDLAQALELRQSDEVVTIAADETIDDTVLIAAETVLIEGTVTGDVVAVGRRIEMSGQVQGNLITFAETITVTGQVDGTALGGSSDYSLRGAVIAGDLWAAAEKVAIDEDSRVGRNATVAIESASVSGMVGADLYAFAETIEVNGALGRNLEVFAYRLRLLDDARVGGDVRFRTDNKDLLHRSPGAEIVGEVELMGLPDDFQERSRYATVEFYLWQAAWLVGAFVTGLIFLWLVPRCRELALGTGGAALKTVGIGFLGLITIPIGAILIALTVVGIPLSIITLAAWMLGVYLAKILVAAMLGRMLFVDSDAVVKNLLVGLAIVVVAINLPFVGGVISFLLTLVGLGLLLQYLFEALSSRQRDPDLVMD